MTMKINKKNADEDVENILYEKQETTIINYDPKNANLSEQQQKTDEEIADEAKPESVMVSDDLGRVTAMISAKFIKGKPYMPWEIQSLDENVIISKKKTEADRQFWLKHHQTLFTRVYPKGTRFDSSNYNPFPGWALGAQVVALNLQTKDEFELLNFSYF